ncbi:MAG: type II secretion system protein [Patescibacteria group bacterium]
MKNIIKNKGFTLIEVLVVMGILAILATIVLIAINPSRQFKQARDTQRTSNVNAILNAIGQYAADHKGTLPTDIDATPTDISDTGADICENLVPTYMPALPADPNLTGGAMADGQITSAECSGVGVYDTNYQVSVDTDGRITVSAVSEVTPASTISVTR